MTDSTRSGGWLLRRAWHATSAVLLWSIWISSGTASEAQTPGTRNAGRFVVVLDAAHGGDDSGARLGGGAGGQQGAQIAEKAVTLSMSVRLRSILTARGFTVATTREGNATLDSDARAQVANRAVAGAAGAACISLHATESGAGVHIFVSSLAPAWQGRFPAWKTAQAAYVARSLKLAGMVNSALEHSSAGEGDGGSGQGAVPATLGRASLPGIDSMTCPAVAVEMAPIRAANHTIATDVTDGGYQAQVVEALANALLEWKSEVDGGGDAGSHPGAAAGGGRTP